MDAKSYGLDDAKKTVGHVKKRLRKLKLQARIFDLHAGWDKKQSLEVVYLWWKNDQKMIFTREWFNEQPDGLFLMVAALKKDE